MKKFILFFLLTTITSCVSGSQTYEGHVAILGSNANRKVFLKQETKSQAICKEKSFQYFRNLVSFKVIVTGSIKPDIFQRSCIIPSYIKVIETPNGRQPLLGVITKQGLQYLVKTQEGDVAIRPGTVEIDPFIGAYALVDTIPQYPDPSKRPYKVIKAFKLDNIFNPQPKKDK